MYRSIAALAVLVALLSSPTTAQRKIRPRDAARELAELYADDQRDQQEWERSPEREAEFSKRQHTRRARVIEILESTELSDFDAWDHAAGLLLHSDVVRDFLLSHVLSVPAGAEGSAFGRFTAAAALDRYLTTTGREQVFGTQFTVSRPDLVEYDVYPAHFVPEHLRQLFRAGPKLRVKNDSAADERERPPKTSELRKIARRLKRAKDEGATPEELALARAAIYGNDDLSTDDLDAAARVLLHATEPADLLLAHVCACGAVLESKRKARKALALAANTLDRWLAAVGDAPLFTPAAEDDEAPVPPLPEFVRRTYLGK